MSSAVSEGDNTLRISFQSAVLAARARAEQEAQQQQVGILTDSLGPDSDAQGDPAPCSRFRCTG